ncbi:sigma-54 interaction domain-containing protein [Spirochaeta isovalerica]|uniref:Transcriptional regulator with PAS, ATPase and Fis domain n=1 Tax=Spirochaeta isovalerica TaxID=150 RepID=A0A841RC26_9SPIO|nr:sigma-54 dependent transcriptional regulator [Spirochaeta isovalerica]MBB6481493.1 transcriptional regulator with PAS, ATPase and Fis domain [Spirochaeta isovalerica]
MDKIETLYSWIGRTDITCYREKNDAAPGPLAQAVLSGRYKRVKILSNWPENEEGSYIPWLFQLLKKRDIFPQDIVIELQNINLKSPTDFTSIYENVSSLLRNNRAEENRTFHLSPGTPAMASIWIILSSGEFPAKLIETSRESGLNEVSIPFNIKADFISKAFRRLDDVDRDKHFEDIIHKCDDMKNLVHNAVKISGFSVPVLIFGESGTGKELISRGIHKASDRRGQFIPVNCGAIPGELVESEFFGHKKGSFTGADADHDGYLKQADKGTLFLDEIGELPLNSQVKLLRALNNGKIRRVGGDKDIEVDIRIIAATNKNLQQEIREGRFREDLFHRLAVGIINMPPLRKREGDLEVLIRTFVSEINDQFTREAGENWERRTLSGDAVKVLLSHRWPGNIRELKNTLKRLIIWAETLVISGEETLSSLLLDSEQESEEDFTYIPPGFDLGRKIDDYKVKWLKLAKEQSHDNTSEAARILGIENYQTLDNWYRKYGLK